MSGAAHFAVRTLVGPWLVLLAIGLEVATFFMRSQPWRGEGLWTVQWFPLVLFILGPLCAGAAAVDASRMSRPGNIHLIRTAPHGSLGYLRAAAWCALPIMVIHFVAIAAALVIGEVERPSVGWWWLTVGTAVQLVAIAWYVALGSIIGRFAPPVLAGIVAAVAGFALFFLLGNPGTGDKFALLHLGAASVSRLGLVYNGLYMGGQATVLVITAVLFLLVGVRERSGLNVPTPTGATLLAVAAAIIVAGQVVLPGQRLVADPQPPDKCWEFFQRRVACMYAEHDRFQPQVQQELKILMAKAEAKGYEKLIPRRIEEVSRTYVPPDGATASLALDEAYESGTVRTEEIVFGLVHPAHCAQLYDPNRGVGEDFAARERRLFVTWMALAGPDVPGTRPDGPDLLRPAEARAILADFARCDLGNSG